MEDENVTMKTVVFYLADGRITHTAKIDSRSLQAGASNYLEVEEWRPDYDATHYVVDDALAPRQVMSEQPDLEEIPADGVAELVLAGVPAGAEVQVIGPVMASGTADGGQLHFTFAAPGKYMISARLFPFADLEVNINAV